MPTHRMTFLLVVLAILQFTTLPAGPLSPPDSPASRANSSC
jgi:hypothetical protein